ncbi:MAG: nucleotidyltransferase family protein, partial [Candidatus Hydrothermarchaeales archaeon]
MLISKYPTVIATVGGEGTRLYPLTLRQPKPLVSILNYPILSRELEILASQGCRGFIIASKGAANTTILKDVLRFGRSLSKKLELKPPAKFMYQPNYNDNGSADAVRYCMDYYNIDNDVLVVSGDNISDIYVKDVVKFHKKKGSLVTVVLKELGADEDISKFGVVDIDEDGRLKRFVEKPQPEEAPSRMISTAIYLFSPEIRETFKEMGDRVKDIGRDVLPFLTENDYPLYGYLMEGYWADVGSPASFLNTAQDILRQKVKNIKFRDKMKYKENRWIHPTTVERIKDKLEKGEIEIGEYVFIG